MLPASLNISLSGEVLTIQRQTYDFVCQKPWTSKRHNNPLDELHIILSGSCQFEIEEELHNLTQGCAILVRAGKFHGPLKPHQNIKRCSFLISVPRGGFLDQQFELLSHGTFPISEEVIDLCHQLDADVEQALPYYKDMLAAKLTLMIIGILQAANTTLVPSDDTEELTELQSMLRTIDHFFSRWPNNVGSEADLARVLKISRHKLNRIIYQNYGMCFRDKLRIAKMDYASWLLRRTDYSCKHIASLCGYTADTSFYKAFRDNFGLAPLAYRKQYTINESTEIVGEDQ